MTLHSQSDHYWIDRQRDMIGHGPIHRSHGLVNSTRVTDRSELAVLASYAATGVARAGKRFGRLVQSAVVRARRSANGRAPKLSGGKGTFA